MPTTSTIDEIVRRLSALRNRIRRIVLLSGTARVLLLAVGLLALSFLADWFLDLPLGVRRFVRLGLLDRPAWTSSAAWIALLCAFGLSFLVAFRRRHDPVAGPLAFVLGGAVGVLAWAALRFLAMPARVRVTDDALALRVEDRFRSLNDRLAASLDFDRELAAGAGEGARRGESPAMMQRVVEQASAEVKGLEFDRVASSHRAWRRAALAGTAAAVFGAVLLAMPETARLWARRSLALEDVAWPRLTSIVAVVRDAEGREREQDPATPYIAALGQSVTVLARAKGRVPDQVEILDRVAGDADGKALPHRMRPLAGLDGLFEYEFRDVRGDFTFALRGGDDRDELPVWSVTVRIPPRIVGVRCDLLFPSYLKMPPRRTEGGSPTVPEGTEVTVSFEADAPLARAEAVLDEAAETKPLAVEEVKGAAAGGATTYQARFTANKSLRYRLKVVTRDGRENDPGVDTYEVAVLPDAPPRSDWVWPRAPLEASPEGRVPLFARTRDDHGIISLALDVRVGTSGEALRIPLSQRSPEAPGAANDRPYGAEQILSYVPLEISSLKGPSGEAPAVPSRVQVRVVAVDNLGQEGGGEWASIDLVRGDEIERRLSSQRSAVKLDIAGVRDDLVHLRDAAADLASHPIGDPEKNALRDLQFKQGKLRTDVERSVRTLAGFFNHYAYDRLGATVPTEHLLAILDGRHRALFTQQPDGTSGTASTTDGDDTEVFPWSLYREVVAARREKVVFDTGILDKMIAVLEASVPTADELAPAAAAAAVEASTHAAPADVAALLSAQERLLKGLDATISAMAEWQSLSELTLLLRRLIDEQDVVHSNIERLNGTEKPK